MGDLEPLKRDQTRRSCQAGGTCASSTIRSLRRSRRWSATRRVSGCGLPHRPLDPQSRHLGAAASPPRSLPGGGLSDAAIRARRDGRAGEHRAAGDRPPAPKNIAFSPEDAVYICDQFGIDVDRPLLCQVSRFDPWKDPLGVIDAYRIVKRELPEIQLALVGLMAADDPEGWDYFNATVAHADGDPDIHILNNLNNVGAIEVNAFQSHCDVVIRSRPGRASA